MKWDESGRHCDLALSYYGLLRVCQKVDHLLLDCCWWQVPKTKGKAGNAVLNISLQEPPALSLRNTSSLVYLSSLGLSPEVGKSMSTCAFFTVRSPTPHPIFPPLLMPSPPPHSRLAPTGSSINSPRTRGYVSLHLSLFSAACLGRVSVLGQEGGYGCGGEGRARNTVHWLRGEGRGRNGWGICTAQGLWAPPIVQAQTAFQLHRGWGRCCRWRPRRPCT